MMTTMEYLCDTKIPSIRASLGHYGVELEQRGEHNYLEAAIAPHNLYFETHESHGGYSREMNRSVTIDVLKHSTRTTHQKSTSNL
jgi:hypothetical protein